MMDPQFQLSAYRAVHRLLSVLWKSCAEQEWEADMYVAQKYLIQVNEQIQRLELLIEESDNTPKNAPGATDYPKDLLDLLGAPGSSFNDID